MDELPWSDEMSKTPLNFRKQIKFSEKKKIHLEKVFL